MADSSSKVGGPTALEAGHRPDGLSLVVVEAGDESPVSPRFARDGTDFFDRSAGEALGAERSLAARGISFDPATNLITLNPPVEIAGQPRTPVSFAATLRYQDTSQHVFVDWENWAPFLDELEHDYGVRYRQNFVRHCEVVCIEPCGRKFYEQPWLVDGGRNIWRRLVAGEKNITAYLDFGWYLETSEDGQQRLMPPPSFKAYYEALYAGLYRRFGDQVIPFNQMLVPCITFLKRGTKDTFLVARPGIDPAPDPKVWEVVSTFDDTGYEIDLPLPTFTLLIAARRPPLNPIMFDHDNGHAHDYLNHRGISAGNVGAFALIAGGQRVVSFDQEDKVGNRLLQRISLGHEELVLPSLEKRDEIRALVPHLFESDQYPSVEANARSIRASLGEGEIMERLERLLTALPTVIIRHGGGMNDSYNTFFELNVRSTPDRRVLAYLTFSGFPLPFHDSGREQFTNWAIESPLGMATDLMFVAHLLENESALIGWVNQHWANVPTDFIREKLMTLLVDRLARIEIFLWAGVHYEITGGRVFSDGSQQIISRHSPTYKFYEAWTIPGSYTHRSFVDFATDETHDERPFEPALDFADPFGSDGTMSGAGRFPELPRQTPPPALSVPMGTPSRWTTVAQLAPELGGADFVLTSGLAVALSQPVELVNAESQPVSAPRARPRLVRSTDDEGPNTETAGWRLVLSQAISQAEGVDCASTKRFLVTLHRSELKGKLLRVLANDASFAGWLKRRGHGQILEELKTAGIKLNLGQRLLLLAAVSAKSQNEVTRLAEKFMGSSHRLSVPSQASLPLPPSAASLARPSLLQVIR